jgi:beta-lactam-binding protein with PASTA domain
MSLLNFFKKHLIIANFLLAVAIVCVLMCALMVGLNACTHHGKEVTIPDVRGFHLEEAATYIKIRTLKYEVTESLFVKGTEPGTILETVPSIGSSVKEGRTIYLKVSSYIAKLFTVPDVMDMSQRQAVSLLSSTGFENVTIKSVPGKYRDLVVGLESKGRTLTVGDKIQASTRLTLLVCSGTGQEYINLDSETEAPIEEATREESGEDWF